MRTLRIGTRASKLALRQTTIVADALQRAHPTISLETREIKTEGDRTSAPLTEIGGLGVFTKAIEDALLAGDIDLAVHSLKDLPTDLTPGLTLAAIPAREDPRDALVTRGGAQLEELASGARIGTGAGRRAVQLLELRPDVVPVEIRGNVDTRIRKVLKGEYDGAVLALAGLKRLGLQHKAVRVFSIEEMLPAVGQGALAVEVRADDEETVAGVRALDDSATRAAVEAERAYLRRLGGGCRLPVGAHGWFDDGVLRVAAMIGGEQMPIMRGEMRGDARDAVALGVQLAEMLLAQGAAEFV
jgi:hydroxymethylbilane synthase